FVFDGAQGVDLRDQVAAFIGDEHGDVDIGGRQSALDGLDEVIDAVLGGGGDELRLRVLRAQAGDHGLIGDIGLVEHEQFGDVAGLDVLENFAHGLDLTVGVRVRGVDDVEQQIG